MEEILKQILGKLNDMEEENRSFRQEVAERFNKIDQRFDRIETELEDVKRVVRLSAEDILENQVEFSEKSDLLDQRIRLLEERQNYTDKRVRKLEKKANEQ
jgi:DNA repair exonuclease SbcCD ATPase subunit